MTPPTITSDEYATSDLGVAAYLLACELPLLRVDHEGDRAAFVFPETAQTVARLFYQTGRTSYLLEDSI